MYEEQLNTELLVHLSILLNDSSTAVTADNVGSLCRDLGISHEEAFRYLLAAYMNLDVEGHDRELFMRYFPQMVHQLDAAEYLDNPYLKQIHLPHCSQEHWEFLQQQYEPYEAFVMDDFQYDEDGRVIPQIGYFEQSFSYPCVKQNGREWMTVTPNEINTMKHAIRSAHGSVLTYGLGLGYYAYMASQKNDVQQVTVVEMDSTVIELFQKYLLPQFEHPEKIRIICADAFEYAKINRESYDFTFADIWHDAGDGVMLYRKLKPLEHGITEYWIYPTMKYYLEQNDEEE